MTRTLASLALALTFVAGASVAHADTFAVHGYLGGDASPGWKPMKPIHAISFDVGRKHVISYFLNKNGLCNLTLMVTDLLDETSEGNEIPTLTTVRFTAEIEGGKTVRLDTAAGKSLEYACGADAQAMSVREVNQIAVASLPRAK